MTSPASPMRRIRDSHPRSCQGTKKRLDHVTAGWIPTSSKIATRHVRLPMVVVDGKPFTWEQVGHMLMTFEGFTLVSRIKDAVEVPGEQG